MTTAQIEHENNQDVNDLYRLLKKYLALRHLIRALKVIIHVNFCIINCLGLSIILNLKEDYESSKMYPIFPRYTMLKDMIKGIMHDPDYMEVCHEVNN